MPTDRRPLEPVGTLRADQNDQLNCIGEREAAQHAGGHFGVEEVALLERAVKRPCAEP
jgi:hypothetical protein